MAEGTTEIRRIPAKVVRQFAKDAATHRNKIPTGDIGQDAEAATRTRVRRAFARFNSGAAPLDKNGGLSPNPGHPKENNMEPFHPASTNAAGVSAEYEELTAKILQSADLNEKIKLEQVRNSLRVQTLDTIHSATGMTEKGDFKREIPKTEEYRNPETGQIIRFVRYNWDKRRDGEPITVSFPAYNTRTDKNSTASVRDAELAAQMPDRPMIAIMHPGMGSGRLTKEQRDELGTDKSYFSIAEAELKLLKELGVGKDDTVDVIGSSMGAFAGLAFGAVATESDFKLHRLVLTSLPGVEKREFKKLVKAMQDSGEGLVPAWTGPFNPDIYQAGFLNRSGIRQALEGIRWVGRALVNDPVLHKFPYAHALAEDTASDRILNILDHHANSSVVLVGGMEDLVSRKDAVYNTLDRVSERYGKDRIAGTFFPGDAHSIGENPYRYAGTVRDALLAQHTKLKKATEIPQE